MGCRAGRKAFSTETYHFYVKQCSKCWESGTTQGELEQRAPLSKGDVAALMALFVFTVLVITSLSEGVWFWFFFPFLYAGEGRKSNICFLQLSFIKPFSMYAWEKYYSHPLGENLVGQSSKCCQWQHGAGPAWLSISSSDFSLRPQCNPTAPPQPMGRGGLSSC